LHTVFPEKLDFGECSLPAGRLACAVRGRAAQIHFCVLSLDISAKEGDNYHARDTYNAAF